MKVPVIHYTCDICLRATVNEGAGVYNSWQHIGNVDICHECYTLLQRAINMGWIDNIIANAIRKEMGKA